MYDVRHLGSDVYLVDGKVTWIRRNAVDGSTEEGRQFLCEHADFMRTSKMRADIYGDLTADTILPKSMSMTGTTYPVSAMHFKYLPEDAKAALREEFPQYADEI